MKRILFAMVLTLVMVPVLSFDVSAQEPSWATQDVTVIKGNDIVLEYTIEELEAMATGECSGTKTCSYLSKNGELLWQAMLSGKYTYTPDSVKCTYSELKIDLLAPNWFVVSQSVGKKGASATAELIIGRKLLGVTVDIEKVSFSLTCDENGDLH